MSEENENQSEVINNDGVSEQQAQEAQAGYNEELSVMTDELLQVKKDLIADPNNIQLKTKFRQLSGFVHNNGAVPDYLKETNQLDGNTPHEPELQTEHEQYSSAQGIAEYKTPVDNLPSDYTSEDINDVKEMALDLQLPKAMGDVLITRFLKHSKDSETHTPGEELGQLSEEQHGEFLQAAAKSFGSIEKFQEAGQKAVNYARNVLSAEGFQHYEKEYGNSSLMYDPYFLQKLAILHDQRGFKL